MTDGGIDDGIHLPRIRQHADHPAPVQPLARLGVALQYHGIKGSNHFRLADLDGQPFRLGRSGGEFLFQAEHPVAVFIIGLLGNGIGFLQFGDAVEIGAGQFKLHPGLGLLRPKGGKGLLPEFRIHFGQHLAFFHLSAFLKADPQHQTVNFCRHVGHMGKSDGAHPGRQRLDGSRFHRGEHHHGRRPLRTLGRGPCRRQEACRQDDQGEEKGCFSFFHGALKMQFAIQKNKIRHGVVGTTLVVALFRSAAIIWTAGRP